MYIFIVALTMTAALAHAGDDPARRVKPNVKVLEQSSPAPPRADVQPAVEPIATPSPVAGTRERLDRLWIPLPCTRVGNRMVC